MNPKTTFKHLASACATAILTFAAAPTHASFYLQSFSGCGSLGSHTLEWPWTQSIALYTTSTHIPLTQGPETSVYYAYSPGFHSVPVSYAGRMYSGPQSWVVVGQHYGMDNLTGYVYSFITSADTCYGSPIILGVPGTAAASVVRPAPGIRTRPLSQIDLSPADKQALRERLMRRDPHGNEDASAERISEVFTSVQKAIGEATETPAWRKRAAADGLSFSPMSVSATRLGSARLVAERAAVAKSPSGWTGLTRVYSLGAGQWAILDELDIAASGASVDVVAEAINTDINGTPASLNIEHGPDGRKVATLAWISGGKSIRLMIGSRDHDARAGLLQTARLLY